MRRAGVAFLTALLLVTLTGCGGNFLPRSQDIANVELLRTMAVDAGERGRVRVTVSAGTGPGDGEEANGGGKPLLLSREGGTVAAACQTIRQSGSGTAFFGHVTECVVSEPLARKGIGQTLDYIQRDFEMRMDTLLFLAEGGRAEELLKKTAGTERAATDQLQEIGRELPLEAAAWPCTVREFLIDLYDNGFSMVPVVAPRREPGGTGVEFKGMAIFRDGKLIDRLDPAAGQGASLLQGRPQAAFADVTLKSGVRVNLKYTGARCRWRPRWKGNRLTGLTARVQVEADLTERNDAFGRGEERELREMEKLLARHVEAQVRSALAAEKTWGDYLHLERRLLCQCPARVGSIRGDRNNWLEKVALQVEARAVVRQSRDIARGTRRSR